MSRGSFLSEGRVAGMRSRLALLLGGAAWVLVLLGCMSFTVGGRYATPGCDPEPFTQSGEVSLHYLEERSVYYPLPFASPPNLELADMFGNYQLVEQQPDFFKVKCLGAGSPLTKLRWKARGQRVVSGAPLVGPIVPTSATLPQPKALDE